MKVNTAMIAKMAAEKKAAEEAASKEAAQLENDKATEAEMSMPPGPFEANMPVFIPTAYGPVMVYGHELVNEDFLIAMHHCLNLPEFSDGKEGGYHGVRTILLRNDGLPVNREGNPILAATSMGTGTISMNLPHTFEVSLASCKKNPDLCVTAILWQNMLMNILHEIHHCASGCNVEQAVNFILGTKEYADEEDMAEEWAAAKVVELVLGHDVEPGNLPDSPVWGSMMIAATLADKETDDASMIKWKERQERLIKDGIKFEYTEDGEVAFLFTSFKEYIRALTEDEEITDEMWQVKTLGTKAPSYADHIGCLPMLQVSQGFGGQGGTNPTQMNTMPMQDQDYDGPTEYDMGNGGDEFDGPSEPQGGGGGYQGNTGYQGGQQQQAAPQTMAPNGIDPNVFNGIVSGVYDKIFAHIFNNCGFAAGNGFTNAHFVSQVPIQLSDVEMQCVFASDHTNPQGQYAKSAPTSAGLFGHVAKASGRPIYKLHLNCGGNVVTRFLACGNPTSNSATGEKVRNGAHVMFVFEDSGNDRNASNKLLRTCTNGQWS